MSSVPVANRGRLHTHHLALQQPFIFASSEDLHRVERHVPNGISTFGIVSVEPNRIMCIISKQGLVELTYFPFGYLASIATTTATQNLLQRCVKLLTDWSGRALDLPILINEQNAASTIPAYCASMLISAHARALNLNKSYMFELSNLRAEHDELQANFLTAENLISSRNIQPIDLVFINKKAHLERGTPTDATFLRQVLPVASQGLASIDVYVDTRISFSSSIFGFNCILISLESGTIIARWSAQIGQIRDGWVNLRLPKALTQAANTLALEFTPLNGIGHLPSLALGEEQPLESFQVVVSDNGTDQLPSSLAMRCWSGLPGVTPPETTFVAWPEDRLTKPAVYSLPLPFTFLAQVQRCATDWRPEFEPVSFNSSESFVEVHPPSEGIMLAKLPQMSLPNSCRIEAQGFVRHRDAAPVQFAIVFSAAPEQDVLANLSHVKQGHSDFYFSGWMTADFYHPALVMCAISKASEKGCIFLATKMKDNAPNAFAWASFRNIRITSLSHDEGGRVGRLARPLNMLSRQIQRDELLLLRMENGDPHSCRLVFPLQKPMVECHVFDSDSHLATIRNLSGKTSKVAVRVTSSPGYSGSVDFGFGIFDGRLDRKITVSDLEGAEHSDAEVVFSGWNEILPTESAVFEVDVGKSEDAVFSLVLAIRSKGQPSCIVLSDFWMLGNGAES